MAFSTPTTSSASTGQVRVSSGDTTADYLINKLVAGANVTLTKNNAGANETISIAAGAGSSGSWRTVAGAIDGINITFTIPAGATTLTSIVALNGQDLVPTTDYSISGTTLTMVVAPLADSIIEIYF